MTMEARYRDKNKHKVGGSRFCERWS